MAPVDYLRFWIASYLMANPKLFCASNIPALSAPLLFIFAILKGEFMRFSLFAEIWSFAWEFWLNIGNILCAILFTIFLSLGSKFLSRISPTIFIYREKLSALGLSYFCLLMLTRELEAPSVLGWMVFPSLVLTG